MVGLLPNDAGVLMAAAYMGMGTWAITTETQPPAPRCEPHDELLIDGWCSSCDVESLAC